MVTAEFHQTFQEVSPVIILKLFHKKKKKEWESGLSNSFHEASITLITESDNVSNESL